MEAALENVNVSHIVMRNVNCPIFLRLGNRARPPYEGAPTPGLGSFRNVMISDVQAVGADKVGCSITGLPERADGERHTFEHPNSTCRVVEPRLMPRGKSRSCRPTTLSTECLECCPPLGSTAGT